MSEQSTASDDQCRKRHRCWIDLSAGAAKRDGSRRTQALEAATLGRVRSAGAGASPGLAAKLSETIHTAFRDARFVEQWRTALTIDPEASSPEALDHLRRSDLERWAGVVKATGFAAE